MPDFAMRSGSGARQTEERISRGDDRTHPFRARHDRRARRPQRDIGILVLRPARDPAGLAPAMEARPRAGGALRPCGARLDHPGAGAVRGIGAGPDRSAQPSGGQGRARPGGSGQRRQPAAGGQPDARADLRRRLSPFHRAVRPDPDPEFVPQPSGIDKVREAVAGLFAVRCRRPNPTGCSRRCGTCGADPGQAPGAQLRRRARSHLGRSGEGRPPRAGHRRGLPRHRIRDARGPHRKGGRRPRGAARRIAGEPEPVRSAGPEVSGHPQHRRNAGAARERAGADAAQRATGGSPARGSPNCAAASRRSRP